MHQSEWLDEAKKVPVGQHRRVYHGAERRPNLVVWNNEESWSAYCHACGTGGKVWKKSLQRVEVEAPVYRKYLNLNQCVTLPVLAQQYPSKYAAMVVLLHSKRMSTALLQRYKPLYNLEDDRIVLRFNGVYMGRDCTERSHAKWLHYHHDNPVGFVYLQSKNTYRTREPVVMTEDVFSAIKINHYTGLSTLCCLGVKISDELIEFILDCHAASRTRTHFSTGVPIYPIVCFDGDDAGDRGRLAARDRFGIRGIAFDEVRVPDGLDPKDLRPNELVELFKHIGDQ